MVRQRLAYIHLRKATVCVMYRPDQSAPTHSVAFLEKYGLYFIENGRIWWDGMNAQTCQVLQCSNWRARFVIVISFLPLDVFWRLCSRRQLKTFRQKEKLPQCFQLQWNLCIMTTFGKVTMWSLFTRGLWLQGHLWSKWVNRKLKVWLL